MSGFNDKVVSLDFDGVIHEYLGWQGSDVFNAPMPGAVEGCHKLVDKGYTLYVLTAREESNHPAIKDWLRQNGFPEEIEVTNVKRPAVWYFDDRAVRFINWYDLLKYVP